MYLIEIKDNVAGKITHTQGDGKNRTLYYVCGLRPPPRPPRA